MNTHCIQDWEMKENITEIMIKDNFFTANTNRATAFLSAMHELIRVQF